MSEKNSKFNGKANNKKNNSGKGKPGKNIKPWEIKKKEEKKAEQKKNVKEYKSFLYLMPKEVSAIDMAKELAFIPKDKIEVWDEEGVIEITMEETAITFENIMESLDKADEKVLNGLKQKVVFACDYEKNDAKTVKEIMKIWLEKFEGKIGADTEDFSPFMTVEEL